MKLCAAPVMFGTGLAEESIHIVLISLNSRLVKGIHPERVAGNRTGKLEEVNKITEVTGTSAVKLQYHVRNAAVGMRKHRGKERVVIDLMHRLAGNEVHTVDICRVIRYDEGADIVIYIDDRLEYIASSLLDILTEGVKVGREDNG